MADIVKIPVEFDLDKGLQPLLDALKDIDKRVSKEASNLSKTYIDNIDDISKRLEKLEKDIVDTFDGKTVSDFTEEVERLTKEQKKNVVQANDLNEAYDKYKTTVGNLEDAQKSLRDEGKLLKKQQQTLLDFNQKNTEAYRQVTDAIGKNALALKEVQSAKTKVIKQFNAETKVIKSVKGSYNELVAETNLLRQQLKDLPDAFGENEREAKKLQLQIKKNTDQLKKFDKEIGDNFRNVGNYSDALKGTTKRLLTFAAAGAAAAASMDKFKEGVMDNAETGAAAAGLSTAFEDGFSVITNRAAKLGSDLIDIFTGGSLNPIAAIRKAFADATDGAIDAAGKAAKAGKEAGESLFNLGLSQEPLRKEVVRLTAELAIQEQISGDTTVSFEKQAAAAKLSSEVQKELTQVLKEINQQEIDILETRINAADNDQLKKTLQIELNELLREQQALDGELTLAQVENAKVVREIRRDLFERELDFAIDAFDNQKTINERRIADDTQAFNSRVDLLNRTKQLADQSFAEQIRLAEQQTGKQLELNELVKIDDEKVIRQRLNINGVADDVTLGRLLEIIRERKMVNQDLIELERDLAEERKQIQEELTKFIAENNATNIQNEQDRAIAFEKIRFEEEKKRIQEELSKTGETALVNKALQEAEIKHQDKLTQIAVDGTEKRSADIDRIAELTFLQAETKILKEIEDEEERAKKIKEINLNRIDALIDAKQQEINAIIALGEDATDAEIELEKLKQERLSEVQKEGENKRLEQAKEFADAVVTEGLNAALDASNSEKERINNELSQQEKNIDRQAELADRGLDNTLAFEERKAAELEKQRLEEERKQQKIRDLQAFYTQFNSFLNSGDGAALAAAKATAGVALGKAIAARLEEGTYGTLGETIARKGQGGHIDSMGISHGRTHKQGGIFVEMEANEGVFSGKEMSNLGTDNFMKIKRLARQGRIVGDLLGQSVSLRPIVQANNNKDVVQAIGKLESKLSAQPIVNQKFDSLGNLVERITKDNRTTERVKIRRRRV